MFNRNFLLFGNGLSSSGGSAPYVGPGDITTYVSFYGLRAYSAATRGNKAINVGNPGNVATVDVSTDPVTGNLVVPATIGGVPTSVTITAGVYVSGTGVVTLTTATNSGLASGNIFSLGAMRGTGQFASLNGSFTAGVGTTGNTIVFTAASGLTLTISGGVVSTCQINKFYDQTGNGNDATNTGTVATLQLGGGLNGLPYADFTNGAGYSPSATFTATVVSYSVVSYQFSSTTGSIIGGISGGVSDSLLYGGALTNQWGLYNANPNWEFAATDNAWHAGQIVSNGVAQYGIVNIDGGEATALIGNRTFSSSKLFLGSDTVGDAAYGYISEAGFFTSQLSYAQRIALSQNQHTYWGTPYSATSSLIISADWQQYGNSNYEAYNSVWNHGSLVNGVDYTQSLAIAETTYPNATTITWSWPNTPASGNVYSFPSITYGYYGSGIASPILPTSKQVNAISALSLSHNVSLTGDGTKYDATYDGYLTSTAYGTAVYEISILVHTPSYLSSYINGLSPLYTYTDTNSFVWTMGVKSAASPPQILIMPQDASDILVHTIDLKAMFAFMIAQGIITGNEYFNGIGLGNEPQQGAGSMTINSFSVNYA